MRLTLPQQDVYYEQLLYPGKPIYNIGAKITITGAIEYEILNRAYVVLMDQHNVYRSIVIQGPEEAEIQILSDHGSVLGFLDFYREDDQDEQANHYMQAMFTKAFDFNDRALLHRFILIKVRDTFHYLFSMYHHIITDCWGTSLMFQRLVRNYNELISGGTIAPWELYAYKNFVEDDAGYDRISLDKNISLNLYPVPAHYNRLPLLINFIEGKENLRYVASYNSGKYDKETMELLFLRYENILNQIIEQADIPTGSLDIKLTFEKEQALAIDFNF